MSRQAPPIDVGDLPDLARLAREVARDGRPRVLRDEGRDLAVLSPARRPRGRKGKTPTPAQRDAVLSAFGAWKGHIDAERFKREVKASRSDDRPPVKL
jgi:hypothetical protein